MTTRTADLVVAAPAGPRERFGWAPLLVVLTGTFMTFLDFFIVNVALPSIQGRLHAGPAAIQLVVAGFGLAFAVGMISGGRLGDLYGRRRMFTVGLALFTVTSAACGLAPTAGFLDVARVLQGGAAAMMTPQVLAILGTIYTGPRRAKAFAAYGMTMGIAGVGGQLIGGALIALNPAGAGWRSIFLINVPVGITALALVRRILPESRGERARVDLVGTALITAALTGIVLPLVEGRQQGWPAWTVLCLAAAPVLLAVFVAHQRARAAGGRAPLVRLALFRDRAFGVGTLTGIAFGAVPASFFFVLALYLQDGRGLSPLVSGVVFSAVGVGFFAAMLTAERMTRRMGRQILAVGAAVVAAGCLLAAWAARAGTALELAPGLVTVGFGIGMVLVPLTATALARIAAEHAGAASGVLTTGQQVGGALGVAVIGVVFFGAAGGGIAHAFAVSLVVLAALTVATAALVQLLPRPGSAS
jgi:EmrB/QacA subfamily drug resistance transporter